MQRRTLAAALAALSLSAIIPAVHAAATLKVGATAGPHAAIVAAAARVAEASGLSPAL